MPDLNEKKYENAILYLTQKLGGEVRGKKKLAKLLYFADFDFYVNSFFILGDFRFGHLRVDKTIIEIRKTG